MSQDITLNLINNYTNSDISIKYCNSNEKKVTSAYSSYSFSDSEDCSIIISDNSPNNIAILSYDANSKTITESFLCPMATFDFDTGSFKGNLTLGASFTFHLEFYNYSSTEVTLNTYSEVTCNPCSKVQPSDPSTTTAIIAAYSNSPLFNINVPSNFGDSNALVFQPSGLKGCFLTTDPILGITLAASSVNNSCENFFLARNANSPTDYLLFYNPSTATCSVNNQVSYCFGSAIGASQCCSYGQGDGGCCYGQSNVFCAQNEILDINNRCCLPAPECSGFCCSSGETCLAGSDGKGSLCCSSGQTCGNTCCINGTNCLDETQSICCAEGQTADSNGNCCFSENLCQGPENSLCCLLGTSCDATKTCS